MRTMHMPIARVRQIYITHQSKEIGDEKMTRQQRKKQLKNNIELTIIYIMYLYMVMMIGIKLLE